MLFKRLNGRTPRPGDERLTVARRIGVGLIAIFVAGWLVHIEGRKPDDAYAFVSIDHDGSEEIMPYWRAPHPDGIGVVTWRIPDAQIAKLSGAPLAIELSGPFSAEVLINGESVGSKGRPGADRASETIGKIDASIPLPSDRLKATGNEAVIRYSSHHLNYRPAHILQKLRLKHYIADSRRPMRFYAVTLLSLGAVIAMALAFWRLAASTADWRVGLLAAGCFGFILTGSAEVSRSFINYAYVWHAPRQAVVSIGLIAFCLCFFAFVTSRWPFNRTTLAIGTIIIGLSFVAGLVFFRGFDGWTSITAGTASIISFVWLIAVAFRSDKNALGLAVLPAALAVSAFISPGRFIDYQALVLSVAVLGYILLMWPDLLSPVTIKSDVTRPHSQRVAVKNGAKTTYIPIHSIMRLRAAGNYTEVHLGNGDHHLDQRGIGVLTKELSDAFVRIHKSHAVHRDIVEQLKSQEGSRYSVQLSDGTILPVGRSRLPAVRAVLDGVS